MGLQGPLRRAEGKGVKRSDHQERSSQFSLSALNSLQGVDFQPYRLFYAQKVVPKMHRPQLDGSNVIKDYIHSFIDEYVRGVEPEEEE